MKILKVSLPMIVILFVTVMPLTTVNASGTFQDQFNYSSCTPNATLWKNVNNPACNNPCGVGGTNVLVLSTDGANLVEDNCSCQLPVLPPVFPCTEVGNMEENNPVVFSASSDRALAEEKVVVHVENSQTGYGAGQVHQFFLQYAPSALATLPAYITLNVQNPAASFPQNPTYQATASYYDINGVVQTVVLTPSYNINEGDTLILDISLQPYQVSFSVNDVTQSASFGLGARQSLSGSRTDNMEVFMTWGGNSNFKADYVTFNSTPVQYSASMTYSSLSVNRGASFGNWVTFTDLAGYPSTFIAHICASTSPSPTPSNLVTVATPSNGLTTFSDRIDNNPSLSTPLQTYTVIVFGTTDSSDTSCNNGGGFGSAIVRRATYSLIITDIGINLSPMSISITDPKSGNATATSTFTITSLNGFSGQVTISSSPVYQFTSQGPKISFSSALVTLSQGQSVTVTVTASVCATTPNGAYAFTLNGQTISGGVSHTATLTVNVSGHRHNGC